MAAEDFSMAVADGLRLSKRIYFGNDRSVAPPKHMSSMERSSNFSFLPTSPMLYAVISDPAMVDNPDIPSYQPYVYGRCDPPALIPLQMNGISLQTSCYLDTAVITVSGSWRVHCVMGSRYCDCRVAIPMGEQGSILGIEIDVPRKSYHSELIAMDEKKDVEKVIKDEYGGFLKSHIFTFTIPQIDGGSNISIKISWSQKLVYSEGELFLSVPFSFPEYVTPAGKKISKKEKIELYVNSGPGIEIQCKTTTHPLKERRQPPGKLSFIYESDVLSWSSNDFAFSYSISSSDIHGGVFLQSPSLNDPDKREMFCFYLYPDSNTQQPITRKVFRKEVIFVIDISGSMRGKLIVDAQYAVCSALEELGPEDYFNIIAFNGEVSIFSSRMELANKDVIASANEWIDMNFVAGEGTNMLKPMKKALEMLSNSNNNNSSIPIIFLVTDGTVEDERQICEAVKSYVIPNQESICPPRVYTFGIGKYCNHYFLRMLATIGRGDHEAEYDADLVDVRMKAFFARVLSPIVVNVTIDGLDELDELEVYPCGGIPDLLSEKPLIIAGRYRGNFPQDFKAKGILGDMSNFVLDMKAHQVKDIPIDKILAKRQIDFVTAQAWLTENKELEEKVAKISAYSGYLSEYSRLVLHKMETEQKTTSSTGRIKKSSDSSSKEEMMLFILLLRSLGVGFGNLTATMEDRLLLEAGEEDEEKLPEAAEIFVKAASNCCGSLCNMCCCVCGVQACSNLNDQCAIVLTQLCGALACLGCFACCEACCGDDS
ncbi:uncharacterized protein LOC124942125 [Impatiens glandulifera]|uniref:uncharacterized protein LOC124942125 n=1 Tax=Impatiens glandulifera TaxID=253017 RepID=UPI001FB08A74|nr:uncharacterized protein LOC124942125 [Impatiens glandulifera]